MAENVLSWILEKGASILSDDKEENSDVLLNAIKDGDLNIVTLLIGLVSDMNKMKFEGESLLSIAALSGHASIAKLLVSKGADIEGIDGDGSTPLHVACREGHLEIVKFLISKGGDINRQTFDGMTPLAMATKRGHVEVLKYLISKGVEIERSNKKGWPPLIWACVRGHLSTANYLLHVGADANGADKGGWSALHFSIRYDRLDVIKSLVSAGADLNWPDEDGTTPLHIACYNGRVQILKYLLSNGADLRKAEFDGRTSLHSASTKGHHNVVSFMLQQKEGVELVNRPDARGETPLHVATSNGFTSIIDTLVSRGGELNAQTNEGQTCLHLAAELCEESTNVEVTEELSKVEAPACTIKDEVEFWSCDCIVKEIVWNRPEKLMAGNSKDALGPAEALMKHLIKKGADVNIADKAEKNPLEYLSRKMAKLVVSQPLTKSHALGGRQIGGASNDADDRKCSKMVSKTRSGKGAPSPAKPSHAKAEEVLLRLSEEIPNDRVMTLGLKLGISQARVARFDATNGKGTEVTSDGTRAMLYAWFNGTVDAEAIPTLKRALKGSGLVRLSEKYL